VRSRIVGVIACAGIMKSLQRPRRFVPTHAASPSSEEETGHPDLRNPDRRSSPYAVRVRSVRSIERYAAAVFNSGLVRAIRLCSFPRDFIKAASVRSAA